MDIELLAKLRASAFEMALQLNANSTVDQVLVEAEKIFKWIVKQNQ